MDTRLVAQRGFTLVEVSIILLTLTILSSIMLPQMGGFNRLARYVRAREDVGAICSVLKEMLDDVGESAFYTDPGPDHVPDRMTPVGLLVGAGAIPLGPEYPSDPGFNWTLPFADEFSVPTDGGHLEPWFWVDSLDNHLVANTPLDGNGRHRWRGPLEMERGFNSLFAWRGPYIEEVISDPWGNRYMANVFAMYNPPGAGAKERFASGVVCYSAGLDGGIDTDFNQPHGWSTGDDDITALLHAGGPM